MLPEITGSQLQEYPSTKAKIKAVYISQINFEKAAERPSDNNVLQFGEKYPMRD